MLVRSTGLFDGVVIGGENPVLVLLVETTGTRDRIGYTANADVPILALEVLRRIIQEELDVKPATPEAVIALGSPSEMLEGIKYVGLFSTERKALTEMARFLEDPVHNDNAIVELLRHPVFFELMDRGQKADEN